MKPLENIQISPLLFQALQDKPLTIDPNQAEPVKGYNLRRIVEYDLAVQHILELGEEEHSSDWDPYYEIKTKTKTYTTESGASQILSYTKYHISFLDYDEDGDETELEVAIKNIVSIKIMR